MKMLLLALILLSQEPPRVHGGHVACYDGSAWSELDQLFQERDVTAWNRLLDTQRAEGRCYLTEDGEPVEIASSPVPGTVRIRRLARVTAQKQAPEPLAFVSITALVPK